MIDDGAGDVLEAAVLDPQLIGVLRVDVDGRRHVAERVADERQAGLCSRIAASRCPSNTESISVNCQTGEVLSVRMP